MNSIQFIGDSHLGPLEAAHVGDPNKYTKHVIAFHSLGGGAVAFELMLTSSKRGLIPNPLLTRALAHISSSASRESHTPYLFFSLGGFIVSSYSWDCSLGEVDVFVEGRPPNPLRGAKLLPQSALLALFERDFENLLECLAHVRKLYAHVALLCPPPPYKHNDEIVSRMTKKMAGQQGVRQPMHPVVRQKLWSLATAFLKAKVASLNVFFVEPPMASLDEEGFLVQECYGDGFHANATYGAMVLDSAITISALVSERMTSSTT